MIIKTDKGYILYSVDGSKRLGGPFSREEARTRQREVDAAVTVVAGGTYGGKE